MQKRYRFSFQEIAEALGTTEVALRKRLGREGLSLHSLPDILQLAKETPTRGRPRAVFTFTLQDVAALLNVSESYARTLLTRAKQERPGISLRKLEDLVWFIRWAERR